MKRTGRACSALLFLVLVAFSGRSAADIAPPPVDACEVLPPGSACYIDGEIAGTCVAEKGEPSRTPRAVCRVGASATGAAAAVIAATASAGAESPPRGAAAREDAATPKPTSSCRISLTAEQAWGGPAALWAVLLGLTIMRRSRRGLKRCQSG
jgi:hypothetical protein